MTDQIQNTTPIEKTKVLRIERVRNGWVVRPDSVSFERHVEPKTAYVFQTHESLIAGLRDMFDWGVND